MSMVKDEKGTYYVPTVEADSMVTVKGEDFVKFWIDAQCKRGRFLLDGGAYDYTAFAKVVSRNSYVKPGSYDGLVKFVGTFGPTGGRKWAGKMVQWHDINIGSNRGYDRDEQIWD